MIQPPAAMNADDIRRHAFNKGQCDLLWELIDDYDTEDFDLAKWLDDKRALLGKERDTILLDLGGKYEL